MRRTLAVVAVALATLALTAACGSDSEPSSGSGPTEPKAIEVTINGDSVTPNGDRVDVAVGQEVVLHVTADKAGEIHVHSTPEQEFEYPAGKSEQTIKDLDQPGSVEVESHTLDKIIVQLEVR